MASLRAIAVMLGVLNVGAAVAGAVLQLRVLLFSIVAAILCLVLRGLVVKVGVAIIDVWIFAFIFFFGADYYHERGSLYALLPRSEAAMLDAFVVGCFGMTLIGYAAWMFPRKRDRSQYAMGVPMNRARSVGAMVPAYVILYTILAVAFVTTIGNPLMLASAARHEREGGILNILWPAIVMYPAVMMAIRRDVNLPRGIWLLVLPVCLCVLVSVLLSGTRYYLGFCLVSLLMPFLHGKQWRAWGGVPKGRILVAAAIVVVCASFMRAVRGGSIGALEWRDIVTRSVDSLLPHQGLLYVNDIVLGSSFYEPPYYPRENAYIVYWWIPRSLWPSKPTMAGHWVVRTLGADEGFGEGHSFSGGFCLPALVDFGASIGSIFCMLYGVGLAIIERFVARTRHRDRLQQVVVGMWYFGVFFMMRSTQTALIFMCASWVAVVLPLRIVTDTWRSGPRIYRRTALPSSRPAGVGRDVVGQASLQGPASP